MAKDENGTVKAFALAAGWDYWMQVPIMKRMTEVLPDMPFEGTALDETNTYQYGPVCVDVSVRGTGVFEGIFKASLKQFEDQYPVMVTFINQINVRSYAAHTKKAHMTEIGTFDFCVNNFDSFNRWFCRKGRRSNTVWWKYRKPVGTNRKT